jgi:BlaI family penicillinase repressor
MSVVVLSSYMNSQPTSTPKPTDAEIEILHILWVHGNSTVRQVHELLSRTKRSQYTTTLKQLQVMTEKGLVLRDESERSHVYRAAVERNRVQQQITSHLIDRVFGGSAHGMLMQLLGSKKVSKKELGEFRQMIDEFEKGKKR